MVSSLSLISSLSLTGLKWVKGVDWDIRPVIKENWEKKRAKNNLTNAVIPKENVYKKAVEWFIFSIK